MIDHQIIISKPEHKGGYVVLSEYNRQEAEKEAEKFRRGEFFKDLIKSGYIVEVKEISHE